MCWHPKNTRITNNTIIVLITSNHSVHPRTSKGVPLQHIQVSYLYITQQPSLQLTRNLVFWNPLVLLHLIHPLSASNNDRCWNVPARSGVVLSESRHWASFRTAWKRLTILVIQSINNNHHHHQHSKNHNNHYLQFVLHTHLLLIVHYVHSSQSRTRLTAR